MNQPTATSRLQGQLLPRKSKTKKNDVSLIYGVKKERSHSKKGKSSHVAKKDNDTYDFPEFEEYKVERSAVSKAKQTGDRRVSQPKPKTSRVGVREKQKKSRIEVELKGLQIKFKPKTSKKESNKGKSSAHANTTKKQFLEAVAKTFRAMDSGNRGLISDDNIDKDVPEPALYFLGEIFLAMKQKKMTVTEGKFVTMCLPLIDSSSPAAVQTFIEGMEKYQQDMYRSARQPKPAILEVTPRRSSILKESRPLQSGSIRKNQALEAVMQQIQLSESKVYAKMSDLKEKKSQLMAGGGALRDSTNRPRINPNTSEPNMKKVSFLTTSKEVAVTISPLRANVKAFNDSENKPRERAYSGNKNEQNHLRNFTFQLPNAAHEVESIPFSSNDSFRHSARKSPGQSSAFGPTNR